MTTTNLAVKQLPATVDLSEAKKKFFAIRAALESQLVEKDDMVQMLCAAFVLQEHCVVLGPHGCAKSMAVDGLMKCVDVAYVREGCHAQMTGDELVGILDLVAFHKHSQYRRNITGGMMTAEAVFLDEVFKTNTATLNMLLPGLNERIMRDKINGDIDIPLRMCAGASNEFPADAALAPLFDRFLFRHLDGYIQSRQAWKDLVFAKANQTTKQQKSFVVPCKLSLAEWDAIKADVDKVSTSMTIVDKLSDIKDALAADGVILSDRRSCQITGALKAAAWLDHEDAVNVDHLQILRFVCWDTPDDREKIIAILASVERSATAKVMGEIDDALRQWRERPQDRREYHEALSGLMAMLRSAKEGVKTHLKSDTLTKRGRAKVMRRAKELADVGNKANKDFVAYCTI